MRSLKNFFVFAFCALTVLSVSTQAQTFSPYLPYKKPILLSADTLYKMESGTALIKYTFFSPQTFLSLSVTAYSGPDHCGQCDGFFCVVSVTGGCPNYNFWKENVWQYESDCSYTYPNLCHGGYLMCIIDQLGVSWSLYITIPSVDGPSASITQTPANCTNADGMLEAFGSGGSGDPYTYLWSSGETVKKLMGLAGGTTRTVTITDCSGCPSSATCTVGTTGNPPSVTPQSHDETCSDATGWAQILCNTCASYSWSTGETGNKISNKHAGQFTVTYTGTNGCTGTKVLTIGNIKDSVTTTYTDSKCDSVVVGNRKFFADYYAVERFKMSNGYCDSIVLMQIVVGKSDTIPGPNKYTCIKDSLGVSYKKTGQNSSGCNRYTKTITLMKQKLAVGYREVRTCDQQLIGKKDSTEILGCKTACDSLLITTYIKGNCIVDSTCVDACGCNYFYVDPPIKWIVWDGGSNTSKQHVDTKVPGTKTDRAIFERPNGVRDTMYFTLFVVERLYPNMVKIDSIHICDSTLLKAKLAMRGYGYRWDKLSNNTGKYVPIPGATNPFFWDTLGADYQLVQTDPCGHEYVCRIWSDVDKCHGGIVTGTTDVLLPNVFPNPFSDFLNVENFIGDGKMYDLNGKKVLEFQQNTKILDTKFLPPGVYYLSGWGKIVKI